MSIKPLFDKVVIKNCEAEETTKSGLILTSASKEKPEVAEVIAVGPGGMVDGKEVVMTVQVGDKVTIFSAEKGLTLEEMAQTLDTISYEIMTSISARVKRIYTER